MNQLLRNGGKFVKWNNNYIVMPYGEVYSIRRRIFLSKCVYRGYFVVTVGKTIRMCRLVGLHFCRKPKGKNVINHLNGNKKIDHYSNLEWTTNSGNVIHAHKMGLMNNPKKNRADMSVPVSQFDLIGNFIKEYPSANEAARQTGISSKWICASKNGGSFRTIKGQKKWSVCNHAGGFVWQVKTSITNLLNKTIR